MSPSVASTLKPVRSTFRAVVVNVHMSMVAIRTPPRGSEPRRFHTRLPSTLNGKLAYLQGFLRLMPDEKLRQPASPTTLLYGAVTGDQPASTDRQPPRPTLAIALVAVVLLVTGHRLARN